MKKSSSAREAFTSALPLFLGFCAAVWLRILVGQPDVSHSATAGLIFAGVLVLLGLIHGVQLSLSKKVWICGMLGGILLCLPAFVIRLMHGTSPSPEGNYLVWTLLVSIVAFAEELFLRGAIYDAVTKTSGQTAAIILGASLFAGLHIPLYGWHAVPLDFAAGLWLGSLRYASGSFFAPAIAHVLADLVAWWL